MHTKHGYQQAIDELHLCQKDLQSITSKAARIQEEYESSMKNHEQLISQLKADRLKCEREIIELRRNVSNEMVMFGNRYPFRFFCIGRIFELVHYPVYLSIVFIIYHFNHRFHFFTVRWDLGEISGIISHKIS